MKLVFPFPPSLNSYWVPVGSRLVLSHKARRYRILVGCEVMANNAAQGLTDRLSVTVRLHMPDKRVRDVDNYCKGLLDAMTHAGVWGDDEQIDRLTIIRTDKGTRGTATVEIESI